MTNYENTIPVITNELQKAGSYLESEQVLVQSMKQQVKEGMTFPVIKENLQKLYSYINRQEKEKSSSREVVNLKYAAAYLKTLLTTPYWQSWIEIV